jgi:hypothetical protein
LAVLSFVVAPAQARGLDVTTVGTSHGSLASVKAADPCAPASAGTATCAALVTGLAKAAGRAGKPGAGSAPAGYGPAQLQSAYGLPSASAGSGQTVAVVSPYDDPDAASDLAAYRAQYRLPACGTGSGITGSACFQKVNQTGGTSYPPAEPGWPATDAESLDLISAVCPNCHILLVEANSSGIADLGAAENEAVALGAKFTDNVWLADELSLGASERTYDSEYFDHPGVAITAPSGNAGYSGGVNYPAASQYVIAVGGTTLTSGTGVRGWTETAYSGSGSGCSEYEPKPAWQTASGCSDRTLDDLAAVADPATPVALYDSYDFPAQPWVTGGGTAAASAIVAAAYALAGTPAAGTYPASYPYENPGGSYTTPGNAYPYPAGLNDVNSGSTGTCVPSYLCAAGAGYDGPTGLGSPSSTASLASSGGLTGSVYSAERDMCIQDAGDALHNGTKIQIHGCLTASAAQDDPAQDWTIESDGTVRLAGQDYCLDAQNGGPDIELDQCDGDLNQQWVPQSNGTLENPNAQQCLTDPSGSTVNGTQLQLTACSAGPDERWTLSYPVPAATGNIRSQIAGSDLCLDDTKGGTGQDNPIAIHRCQTGSAGASQQWTVEPDGTVQISGHCMAAVKDANGALVALYRCTGDTNQRWTLRSDGTLVNTRSGKCLDDPDGSTANGTQVLIQSCDGDSQQDWILP